MKAVETSADKAKVTTAIRAYLNAKAEERAAKAEAAKRQAELLEIMDGDTSANWSADDGRSYSLSAVYGKTRQTLSKELIEKVFNIALTEDCYSTSKPWNELRITIVS